MINTELHNQLIEQEIQRKIVESETRNIQAKRGVLKEKLVHVLLISGVIFIILLMLIFLYWIFPNKSFSSVANMKQLENLIKENSVCVDKNSTSVEVMPEPKKEEIFQKGTPKNGTEYIKKDNYIFERTWKNGLLIQERRLEPTIRESETKSIKKIPTVRQNMSINSIIILLDLLSSNG